MTKWDIYLANVPYEDLSQSKLRPVIILDSSAIIIDCIKNDQPSTQNRRICHFEVERGGIEKAYNSPAVQASRFAAKLLREKDRISSPS